MLSDPRLIDSTRAPVRVRRPLGEALSDQVRPAAELDAADRHLGDAGDHAEAERFAPRRGASERLVSERTGSAL